MTTHRSKESRRCDDLLYLLGVGLLDPVGNRCGRCCDSQVATPEGATQIAWCTRLPANIPEFSNQRNLFPNLIGSRLSTSSPHNAHKSCHSLATSMLQRYPLIFTMEGTTMWSWSDLQSTHRRPRTTYAALFSQSALRSSPFISASAALNFHPSTLN